MNRAVKDAQQTVNEKIIKMAYVRMKSKLFLEED